MGEFHREFLTNDLVDPGLLQHADLILFRGQQAHGNLFVVSGNDGWMIDESIDAGCHLQFLRSGNQGPDQFLVSAVTAVKNAQPDSSRNILRDIYPGNGNPGLRFTVVAGFLI